MSIKSMLEVLRPKTKTSAIVTFITTTIFLICYVAWSQYFVIASIYLAVYFPLIIVLFVVFHFFFSSIQSLWTLSKTSDEKKKSEPVRQEQKYIPTNMLDMESPI